MRNARLGGAVLTTLVSFSISAAAQPNFQCDAALTRSCLVLAADAETAFPLAPVGVPSNLPGAPDGDFLVTQNYIEGLGSNDQPYIRSLDELDRITGAASFAIPEVGEITIANSGTVLQRSFLNDRWPQPVYFTGQPLSGAQRGSFRASWSLKYRRLPPPEVTVGETGVRLGGRVDHEPVILIMGLPLQPSIFVDVFADVTIHETGGHCIGLGINTHTGKHWIISAPQDAAIKISFVATGLQNSLSATGPGLVSLKPFSSPSTLASACRRRPALVNTIKLESGPPPVPLLEAFMPAIAAFGGIQEFEYDLKRAQQPPIRALSDFGFRNAARLIIDDLTIMRDPPVAPPIERPADLDPGH